MEIVSIYNCIMPAVKMLEGNQNPVCLGINHNIFTLNSDTENICFQSTVLDTNNSVFPFGTYR